METRINYHEYRERGGTSMELRLNRQTVEEVDEVLEALRGPRIPPPPEERPPPSPIDGGPGDPDRPPRPPSMKIPYFDIGDVSGKVNETVRVPVTAGCRFRMDGFHIGGGLAGYKKLKATGVVLGNYLNRYLRAQELIDSDGDHYFSKFKMANWDDDKALPEEWWEYMLGFFSIEKKLGPTPPIPIPSGTLLFKLEMLILPQEPGELELTCKDEHYYTTAVQRRRDFTYTFDPQGYTAIDTRGGKITVTA